MRAIRRFLALPVGAQAIVARSLLLLPFVAALLGTAGFARTRAWLRRTRRHAPAIPAQDPAQIARLVHGTAALLHVGCLPRSLVLLQLLAGYGARARLRFGVRRPPVGGLAAHAWIELDGEALGESTDLLDRHAVLPTLPVPTAGPRVALRAPGRGARRE